MPRRTLSPGGANDKPLHRSLRSPRGLRMRYFKAALLQPSLRDYLVSVEDNPPLKRRAIAARPLRGEGKSDRRAAFPTVNRPKIVLQVARRPPSRRDDATIAPRLNAGVCGARKHKAPAGRLKSRFNVASIVSLGCRRDLWAAESQPSLRDGLVSAASDPPLKRRAILARPLRGEEGTRPSSQFGGAGVRTHLFESPHGSMAC
jgi:hypothetical protein